MTTSLIRETMKWMFEVPSSDVDPVELSWFDITGVDLCQGPEVSWLRECRPPFEKCMVLWRGKSQNHAVYDCMMMIVGNDPAEGVLVSVWKGPHGQLPRALPTIVYLVEDDVVRYGAVDENEIVKEEDAAMVLGLVTAWIASMSRGCDAYRPTVKDSFTNRRKLAEGKLPSYDWHTVTIKPAQSRAEPQGVTHASPRLHDRRGHLRRLKTGKNVWVKPCKVGDASRGTVFKDYQVEAST